MSAKNKVKRLSKEIERLNNKIIELVAMNLDAKGFMRIFLKLYIKEEHSNIIG